MKKYKVFVSRKEWIIIIATLVLLALFLIWYIVGKDKDATFLLFQLPLWIFMILIQIKEVRLHDNDMLELRQYIKNKAFNKPISVQQVTSCKRDGKNKLTLVYYRDQLRGDWTIRLSEKDTDAFISELTRRNRSIAAQ